MDPLCCPEGHLYCKGCIYESLLQQKQSKKLQFEKWEKQEQEKKGADAAEAAQKRVIEVAAFVNYEGTVLPSIKMTDFAAAKPVESEAYIPQGFAPTKTADGTLYVPVETELTVKKKSELVCYWIPSKTPSAELKVDPPSQLTQCPSGSHPLRLKQLFPMHFTSGPVEQESASAAAAPEKEVDPSSHSKCKTKVGNSGKYICPCCRKTLTNVLQQATLRNCGHVVCMPCVKMMVAKEKVCTECGKVCSPSDIVVIKHGGTSFASKGSTTVSSKLTPAFQCS